MATMIRIEDEGDPRLGDYRDLRDATLRKSMEAEHGLFLAEGEKVVRRAVERGYPVRSFLLAERWLDSLSDVLATSDAPCYLVSPELAERVTGFHVHRGALASMRRRPLPEVEDVVGSARRIVICEDIVDHTNVGAIFRSAAALGMDAVVLAPRCADPLYRRAVKVSMGSVFTLPYARMRDWWGGLGTLRAAGFRLMALTPAEDAIALPRLRPSPDERIGLLLGAEGDGLSSRWQHQADERVRIPLVAGIDSLNVAAAAAVACYALAAGGGHGVAGSTDAGTDRIATGRGG